MDTIGFIGVGNMGSAILKGIAGSSLKQETSLFAYNPTEAKVDALANCGVQKCGSAARSGGKESVRIPGDQAAEV